MSIDDALRRIRLKTQPIEETEMVPLAAAAGRVLAGKLRARSMVPPFDNAAMDGYAVDTSALSGEGPWSLRVTARAPAGQILTARVEGLTTVRIFTGAPVPEGADAVVMQEDVNACADEIALCYRPDPGLNIRPAGGDISPGACILAAGQRLGPREIAAVAAAGHGAVCVRRRIRVGLLVTGNELREPGSTRNAAEIWDVNAPMLSAAMACPAVDIVTVVHGSDERASLQRQLEELSSHVDIVVTTGGISAGEEDHVKPAAVRLGNEIYFSGVAMKPGKPVSYGRLGAAYWLGLPGNPLSSFVTWELFGKASLSSLMGQNNDGANRRHVVTGKDIKRKAGRCELRPALIEGFDSHGREVVSFSDAIHSERVCQLPESDGLIFVPADTESLPAGALVEFHPFGEM